MNANNTTARRNCQCCNGSLPALEVWEANRDAADECNGSVDATGRCRAFSRDELWEIESDAETLVCGNQVQVDHSGVGHAWFDIDAEDIPANIREEMEGEMIDGGKDECEDFVGSNGLHYRW